MIPSPSSSPSRATTVTPNKGSSPVDFSPTLIAMVVVAAAALLAITYSRNLIILVRRCRRRRNYVLPSQSSLSNMESPPPPLDHVYSPWPYGLDESVIKTIPLSAYGGAVARECAVCLMEFEEKEKVRTLPVCSHAFHVDCIDIWLRSHANCPLCRSRIFLPEYSGRIRPSLHHHLLLDYTPPPPPATTSAASSVAATTTTTTTNIATTTDTCCIEEEEEEEEEEPSYRRNARSFDYGGLDRDNNVNVVSASNSNSNRRILLKRSYSFGFERSGFLAASERMLGTEASPWRFRRGVFWYKPHLMMMSTPFKTARVFSFRHYHRASAASVKSPLFFRRRRSSGGLGFYPLSDSFSNLGSGGSWRRRRSRSMASPMFLERLRFGEW